MKLLVAAAITICCASARAAEIMVQLQSPDGKVVDVYNDTEDQVFIVRDRYGRQNLFEIEYSEASVDKDAALQFYCSVKQPEFSDVFVCP